MKVTYRVKYNDSMDIEEYSEEYSEETLMCYLSKVEIYSDSIAKIYLNSKTLFCVVLANAIPPISTKYPVCEFCGRKIIIDEMIPDNYIYIVESEEKNTMTAISNMSINNGYITYDMRKLCKKVAMPSGDLEFRQKYETVLFSKKIISAQYNNEKQEIILKVD